MSKLTDKSLQLFRQLAELKNIKRAFSELFVRNGLGSSTDRFADYPDAVQQILDKAGNSDEAFESGERVVVKNGVKFSRSSTLPKQLDTSKVTNMSYMFYYCSSLTSIPQLDTSKVTNMSYMFYYCRSLTSIPQLDTSKVTDMNSMFSNSTSLTSIPQLDTSKVTNMSYMFYSCLSLTSIPQLDTSKVTNMSYMFYICHSLTSIPALDTSKVTDMTNFMASCYVLTFVEIHNLGKSSLETYPLSGATAWGTGSDENRQSVVDSLLTYSYDRAANGMTTATIQLSAATKALLTDEEVAAITAKGFTLA